ncbi:hypothetical protein [Roseomonas xinghualingensis]|uniref:hypothetical protein n=1 Tax=Roseomonas xinghualingensis TaxID=2986475 RepID=UPI0021F2174D|nr:hypothetical protein [Roseomonas sp. SXEYE001]MCV4209216.1 hypothetical protein [Roseomonas sp. SXEYE001]
MLAHIAREVHGVTGEVDREEQCFAAFFGFLQQRPAFFRILNGAELFAPEGFRKHFANIADDCLAALRNARARGTLPGFMEDELEPLVFLLMAMHSYTSMRYAYADDGQAKRRPDALWSAYAKLIRNGLTGGGPELVKRQDRNE